MIRIVNEGIRKDDSSDKYVFDYYFDYDSDIIDLSSPKIYRTERLNKILWFAYKFNDSITSSERTEFIHYLKGIGKNKISDYDLRKLIEYPLKQINEFVNMYKIDAFVYPTSQKSNLVPLMVKIINEYVSRDVDRVTFELVKSLPKDIEFDWNRFNSENQFDSDDKYETNRYNQMVQYINNDLMPKIKKLDYFSLARNVKQKYREYMMNIFSEDTVNKLNALEGKNILIIDDILTTGSTVEEIIKDINKVNENCNIFVYTLIGKGD